MDHTFEGCLSGSAACSPPRRWLAISRVLGRRDFANLLPVSAMAPAHGAHVCRTQEQAGFRLAWCYERCKKPENVNTVGELHDIAESFGSKLVLHKKSTAFVNWLRTAKDNIFLLADWREAKPIVEGLGGLRYFMAQRQLRICILAQSQSSYRNASEWAAGIWKTYGRDILVLDGFSSTGVEDFIAQSLEDTGSRVSPSRDMDADSTRACSEDLVNDEPFDEPFADYACSLSLPSLMRAVQDPRQAARIEQMLKCAMWQTYED